MDVGCGCGCVHLCLRLRLFLYLFLCVLLEGKGTARHSRTQALTLCLTSNSRALVLVCFVTAHFLICVFEPWQRPLCAVRPSLRQAVLRVRVGLPTRTNTSRCPTEPRIGARLRARSAAPARQQSLHICAGTEHSGWDSVPANWNGPTTSTLDKPIDGMVSYQPIGNDLTPLTTERGVKSQLPGNGTTVAMPAQFLPTGETYIPNSIVEAQLTHPISRDDDIEMPAAPLTHDISAPRRLNGGRCRKWAVSTHQTTEKLRCASCTICVAPSLHRAKRDSNSGAIVTLIVHTSMRSVSTVVLLMIVNYTKNSPLIRTLLKPLPASATASSRDTSPPHCKFGSSHHSSTCRR